MTWEKLCQGLSSTWTKTGFAAAHGMVAGSRIFNARLPRHNDMTGHRKVSRTYLSHYIETIYF